MVLKEKCMTVTYSNSVKCISQRQGVEWMEINWRVSIGGGGRSGDHELPCGSHSASRTSHLAVLKHMNLFHQMWNYFDTP